MRTAVQLAIVNNLRLKEWCDHRMGTSVYSGDSATGVPPSAVVAAAIATAAADIGIPSDPAAVTATVPALHLSLKSVISRLTASLFRAPGSGFRKGRGVDLLEYYLGLR